MISEATGNVKRKFADVQYIEQKFDIWAFSFDTNEDHC